MTRMPRVSRWIGIALSAIVLFGPRLALAALERVGPTDDRHGFPAWYQDATGLTLEFCSPENTAELEGGWCLLLPTDTSAPETFPAPFSEEHFYWSGEALGAIPANGSRALLVLALEAAFGIGPVADGDQMVFGRVRIRVDALPYNGTYWVYTPYGVYEFAGQRAGAKLFFTEDLGITCAAGNFDCALSSSIGPFLLPSNAPGGAELPPVAGPVPGKLYIAAPDRVGPVTGSRVGEYAFQSGGTGDPNRFRIEVLRDGAGAPEVVFDTTDFSLVGRVHTSVIPGSVKVRRASYATGLDGPFRNQLDVFATGTASVQGRLPAQEWSATVRPVLAFYTAPCGVDAQTGTYTEPNAAGVPMVNEGSTYWGQAQDLNVMPSEVCVEDYTPRDASGQVKSFFFPVPVVDQVYVTEAVYDPRNGGSLSVKARSSDALPELRFTIPAFSDVPFGPEGIVIAPLAAPPERIVVKSDFAGLGESQVTTLAALYDGGGGPVAVNDVFPDANGNPAVVEDGGPVDLPVLANDTGVALGTVAVNIVNPPRLGTASVFEDGTIQFTPAPNANGTEGIGYTVSVTIDGKTKTSNIAYATIYITAVNDAPQATADAFEALVGTTALNLLANDVDIDGAADLVAARIVTAPVGATITNLQDGLVPGGIAQFAAAAPGTYSFTYVAVDASGATSGEASVSVVVRANETVAITRAEYRQAKSRLRIDGSLTPVQAGQTVQLAVTRTATDGTVTQHFTGTATTDAAGLWTLDTAATLPATGTLTAIATGPARTVARSTIVRR